MHSDVDLLMHPDVDLLCDFIVYLRMYLIMHFVSLTKGSIAPMLVPQVFTDWINVIDTT